MVKREGLSLASARRIALAAQGFGEARPAEVLDWRRMGRVVQRLHLLQIDSVSVSARAHYMPLFSRLGAYPRATLEGAAWGRPRRLFEYWAHEASLLPLELQPLLRWRMERAAAGLGIYGGLARFAKDRREAVEAVFRRIETEGALATSQMEGPKGRGGWWGWSDTKQALEYLFWAGRITTATRRGFQRVYDLPERVLPAAVHGAPTPSLEDAQRELLMRSAQALGIATSGDLRDYFRLSPEDVRPRLAELVEAGALLPVAVEGWSQPAYLHPAARVPRRITATALLSPFDPLVFERDRTERLFGFRYRIEIYTPAEKRVHGYYVLPFLLGERLVARVDLKADRAAGTLRVLSAHAEPHAPAETAEALMAELVVMAGWLGLAEVTVVPAGDLGPALAALRCHGPVMDASGE
ncbi:MULTISPECIES: winged helix-turn-helix domain-containing protein [unclassified Aureimonas]|uniref:winged helix-turn-helix domain-containing protein n=1 Tax=unclassified Aureimonas TaxID=2615206 RepID=UPI0006F9D971|nr:MULTISPECIES: winged helix-turn-helix domain-containing protein [unclassified Aureimonas]KQT53903.1 cytoplasmic protein [Aureimonas sp. Leaf427]KQT71655.1 cytoplasmic protein [Aureimonas sp. Leaf460]